MKPRLQVHGQCVVQIQHRWFWRLMKPGHAKEFEILSLTCLISFCNLFFIGFIHMCLHGEREGAIGSPSLRMLTVSVGWRCDSISNAPSLSVHNGIVIPNSLHFLQAIYVEVRVLSYVKAVESEVGFASPEQSWTNCTEEVVAKPAVILRMAVETCNWYSFRTFASSLNTLKVCRWTKQFPSVSRAN